ncbi:hypothetical protein QBC39DRAFT_260213 [Podospora conica]|nr:hypothetical protein QBC39DRAFT_260213 [Schizothecium conicum]
MLFYGVALAFLLGIVCLIAGILISTAPLSIVLLAGVCLNRYFDNVFADWAPWAGPAIDPASDEFRLLFDRNFVTGWLNTQRAIVDFSFFSSPDAPLPDLSTRLELRAQANARLVRAFGITNSLTTSSIDTNQQFHDKATRLINQASQDPDRWTRLYSLAEGLLKQDVVHTRLAAKPLGLADCVRRMCLAVVLVDNFGDEGIVHEKGGLLGEIAARVNEVWVKSKCDVGGEGGRDEGLEEMIGGLGLRDNKGQGELLRVEEILGIIMPQYETLWRVVLLTFVTAFHRQARKENAERVKGVPGCLGKKGTEEEALKVAQEGLRLYPSNKRIYRARGIGMEGQVSADVEACHRNVVIWGFDALQFRPERFDRLSDLQSKAYFPYSMGKHKCPAYRVFGNRMITMLVVVLSRVMSPETGRVRFRDDKLDHGGADAALPTGRDELEAWVFDIV